MPILPRPVSLDQQIRADDYNKLLEYVRSLQVLQGVGIRLNKGTNGTIVSLQDASPPEGGGGTVSIVHPFQVTDASDEDGANIGIRFGLLNNLTPTLDDGVTELEDLITPIPLTPDGTTGTWIIFMAVAIVDDDSILVPEIDYVYIVAQKDWTEAGDGGDPALLGYQIIAEVDVVAGDDMADPPTTDHVTEIRQNVTHGLRHQICGRQVADEEASPAIPFSAGFPTFWGI